MASIVWKSGSGGGWVDFLFEKGRKGFLQPSTSMPVLDIIRGIGVEDTEIH